MSFIQFALIWKTWPQDAQLDQLGKSRTILINAWLHPLQPSSRKKRGLLTPLDAFLLAFHSSSWALVLASTFTSRFLSPICRSWSRRSERSVDSGSLYSQNPNAGPREGGKKRQRSTRRKGLLASEVQPGQETATAMTPYGRVNWLPCSFPEAPWTLFQLKTIPHF